MPRGLPAHPGGVHRGGGTRGGLAPEDPRFRRGCRAASAVVGEMMYTTLGLEALGIRGLSLPTRSSPRGCQACRSRVRHRRAAAGAADAQASTPSMDCSGRGAAATEPAGRSRDDGSGLTCGSCRGFRRRRPRARRRGRRPTCPPVPMSGRTREFRLVCFGDCDQPRRCCERKDAAFGIEHIGPEDLRAAFQHEFIHDLAGTPGAHCGDRSG